MDRRRIDIDVDLLRVRRERVEASGDAVVEARADADHDVAVMHRHVGLVGPVHAEHAEPVLARGWIGAEPHQRRGDREVGEFDQFAQQLGGFRPGIDDAATRINDRPARIGHQLDGGADGVDIALDLRLVALLDRMVFRRRIGAGGKLHVLGHVDQYRSGTTGLGDAEGLVDDAGQIVDVLDQPVVLGARPGDADGVAFLEGVGTDQRSRNLARDADQRNAVHQGVLQRRHRIGGPRPGGHQHDPDLAGRAGIALGRVAGSLFVAHQNMLDLLLLEDLVIDRQYGPARIAENMLDAVILQRLEDDLGARHLIVFARHASSRLILSCWIALDGVATPVSAIKKGPLEEPVCSAWVAVAGWLHHPAHALSHHNKDL